MMPFDVSILPLPLVSIAKQAIAAVIECIVPVSAIPISTVTVVTNQCEQLPGLSAVAVSAIAPLFPSFRSKPSSYRCCGQCYSAISIAILDFLYSQFQHCRCRSHHSHSHHSRYYYPRSSKPFSLSLPWSMLLPFPLSAISGLPFLFPPFPFPLFPFPLPFHYFLGLPSLATFHIFHGSRFHRFHFHELLA